MLPYWLFLIYYFYGIPMILLYIAIIYVLLKHREIFSSVFYTLVAVFGIQHIVYYIICQYTLRGPTNLWAYQKFFSNLEGFSARLHAFLLFLRISIELNAVSCTIVLALNRCSSVLYPFSHERAWRKLLPFLFGFFILLPIVMYGYINLNKGILLCARRGDELFGCLLSYDHSVTWNGKLSVSGTSRYIYTIVPCVSGVLNCIALGLLYSRKKALKSHKTWRQEINLTVSSFLMFLVHIGYGIMNMIMLNYYINGDLVIPVAFCGIGVPLVFDFAMAVTITSLLVASKPLRRKVFILLLLPWNQRRHTITNSVLASSSVKR
ncbi:unnamed protein product [Bursaphelenchus okinawaensis]|uniref:Serpentine receptor class gamma n=1 Tax=Bursaphelenchus okinawaensis TaxID=465554 RepID=A0A811K264_9BILA|nr:unnamed protein product [Bursaphelenchus okinawaensis]CAG9090528.1 unnamed protein product [Bursaphelenchus okinawaensis]